MRREALEIEREFGPFPEHPHVGGVTFDGTDVWFAAGSKLQAIDPESGELTRALDVKGNAGVAFDGTHLYQIAEGRIQKLDPKTGRVLHSIPAPSADNNSGLAWAEGSLWLGRGAHNEIVELNPETGKVLSRITSDRFVTGVSFSEGELWHATFDGAEPPRSELRRVDRHSGEVLQAFDLPEGTNCSGLEADGKGRFFCGGGKSGKLRVVRPRKSSASG